MHSFGSAITNIVLYVLKSSKVTKKKRFNCCYSRIFFINVFGDVFNSYLIRKKWFFLSFWNIFIYRYYLKDCFFLTFLHQFFCFSISVFSVFLIIILLFVFVVVCCLRCIANNSKILVDIICCCCKFSKKTR